MSERQPDRAPEEAPTARERWWLAAVIVVAVLVRLVGLTDWAFDQDELYTLRDATDLGARTGGPGITARPLYYLLQHALLAVLAPTPLFLRLPPLLFGIAGVCLTWRLGRRAFGPAAGLVAALLVALSPWHTYSSQFARYWTLVYAMATATLLLLPWAMDADRPRAWLLAIVPMAIGALTHPTFAFPLMGVVLALHLVRADGALAWHWPTRTALLAGWVPLLVVVGGVFVAARLWLPKGVFGNGGGRGLLTTLRVVPGMVQWLGPELVVVALLAAVMMVCARADRRWGVLVLAGSATGIGLLLVSGMRNDVYADYGMAMLPLVFVTAGGAVQRLGERAGATKRTWIAAATLVLVTAELPGLVSHLSDGTRFDYRPALDFVSRSRGGHAVIVWPIAQARYYAQALQAVEFDGSAAQLDRARGSGGAWVIASFARNGLVADDGTAREWLERNCLIALRTERQRVDYRSYRVEVRWCGPPPIPGPERPSG